MNHANGRIYIATKPPEGGGVSDAGSKSVEVVAINLECAEALCAIYGLVLNGLSIS